MSVTTVHSLKPSVDRAGITGNEPAARRASPASGDLEVRLRRAEDRWELLTLVSEQGLWDWVPGTDEMYWSPQVTRMLGYADDEIVPCVGSFNALVHPDDHATAWRAFDEHAEGKTQLCETQFRLRNKDGSFRWIQSRAKARFDAHGKVTRMVGVHVDISGRKPAEQPEAARPSGSMDLPRSSAHCGNCHSDLLVGSRWRFWELPLLLLLQRPVRCRSCGRRAFKFLWARVPGRVENQAQ